MSTVTFDREYRNVDKSGWGDGPWSEEPDKAQWVDPDTGYDCLIVRSYASGALCGYVGLPPEHPLHGKDYDDIDVSVHGDLTYSAACQDTHDESIGICHVPLPGRSDHAWWFGFDCNHYEDIAPAMEARLAKYRQEMARLDEEAKRFFPRSVYRPVDYVVAECTDLAAQLSALA